MDELIKAIRQNTCHFDACGMCPKGNALCLDRIALQAADAIEELSAKVDSLQAFADNISKLPDCNTCLKKNLCEFIPKYGEYCRINCPAWLGQPPKEEE